MDIKKIISEVVNEVFNESRELGAPLSSKTSNPYVTVYATKLFRFFF